MASKVASYRRTGIDEPGMAPYQPKADRLMPIRAQSLGLLIVASTLFWIGLAVFAGVH